MRAWPGDRPLYPAPAADDDELDARGNTHAPTIIIAEKAADLIAAAGR